MQVPVAHDQHLKELEHALDGFGHGHFAILDIFFLLHLAAGAPLNTSLDITPSLEIGELQANKEKIPVESKYK